jgi:hypothetical protein
MAALQVAQDVQKSEPMFYIRICVLGCEELEETLAVQLPSKC